MIKHGEAKIGETKCSACAGVSTTTINGHLACERCAKEVGTLEKTASDDPRGIFFPSNSSESDSI